MAAAPLLEERIDEEVPDAESLGSLHDEYAEAISSHHTLPVLQRVQQRIDSLRDTYGWLCIPSSYLIGGACCSTVLWMLLGLINTTTFSVCDAGIAMGCDAMGDNHGSNGFMSCTRNLPLCDFQQLQEIRAQSRTDDPYSIGIWGYVGIGLSPLVCAYSRTALTFLKTGASEVCRGIASALR
jgi:hypothetical protein